MSGTQERKHWLLSRKFWLAVITAITLVLQKEIGLELDPEVITGIIVTVVAYIVGESAIDMKNK